MDNFLGFSPKVCIFLCGSANYCPFSLFYYKFIKSNGKTDKAFWQYQIGTRQHNTWAGLAFEQLCLNHHKQIEQALGIAVISTKVYSWTAPQTAEEQAQIDLIIKRADKVINVCEMKFYDGDYVMKKKDHDDIERRVRAFRTTNEIRQARKKRWNSIVF